MADILDPQNYTFRWLSLPYFLVTAGLVAMGVYALVMRGAQLLRASFVVICAGLVPLAAAYALAGSTTSPEIAMAVYKLGLALVPTAAAGVFAFESILAQQVERYGWFVFVTLVLALAQSIPVLVTDWYVAGIGQTSWGLYHFHAGPLAPLHLAAVALWGTLSGITVYRRLGVEQSLLRRRQLQGSMIAFTTLSLSTLDALLAYGVGIYPVSWLFLGVGTVLMFRSLIIDDLIHTRALDWRTPLMASYLAAAALGIWLVWRLAGGTSLVLLALLHLAVYLILRILIALVYLVRHPYARFSDTPLERVIDQFSVRLQSLQSGREIAEITSEAVSLGLGCKDVRLVIPSPNDLSWTTIDGQVLSEEATPNPMSSLNWLMENARPLQRIELPAMPLDDLREPVTMLFTANRADVLVPLVHDDMEGMLILGGLAGEGSLGRSELRFLDKVQEHLRSALVYARLHKEANQRAAMQVELELAAAIQSAFVSSADLVDCGNVQVSGLYAPAKQCGGDWWSVHQLPDGRVLVLIGDVTGHGVAAAMVTAAAKGCYDVAQRLMGENLDVVELLNLLDDSVRMMGVHSFHMTCFATLLDPARGIVTYANAGHVAPYVCRTQEDGTIDLGSLVARGNPLGAGDEPRYKSYVRDLARGDIIIWYTDGIVECTDPEENQFGERRMQRLLRKLDEIEPGARSVRDHIVRAVAAFQNGRPSDDDITLVVGRIM